MTESRQTRLLQHIGGWPISLSVVIIAAATYLLALSVWPHGNSVSQDSSFFWRAAVNMHQGNGIGWDVYLVDTDEIVFSPLTHHPPLLIVCYSLLMYLPIDPARMTAVLSLMTWPLFLLGVGALTYRLSRAPGASVLAITCAALTPSFWYVFSSAFVEVLFLPLLVWYMALLVDVNHQPLDWKRKLVPAGVVLALLLLTRYTGVFVLGASAVWWAWWAFHYRSVRFLLKGWGLFALATVPLLIWLLRNALVSDQPLSHHLVPSGSFLEGIQAFGKEGFRMLIPVLDIDNLRATLSSNGVLVFFALYGVSFLIGLVVFWRFRPRSWEAWLAPHRAPVQVFSLFYIMLYTIIQPFLNFWPIDLRDITTLYCMLLPFVFGTLAQMAGRVALLPLGMYTALTVALMLSPVVVQGLPDWVDGTPPRIGDVGNRDLIQEPAFKTSGIISLIKPTPVRMTNLRRHFPELATRIDAANEQNEQAVVLTNDLRLFTITDLRALEAFILWDRFGRCQSRHNVLIVAFDWAILPRYNQEDVRQLVEERCPTLSAQTYDNGKALVYELAPRAEQSSMR